MTGVADEDSGFRAGLLRGELLVPACTACGRVLDYTRRICDKCGGGDIGWSKASGNARLRCAIEMTVSYSLKHPAPYWIASVELEEGPHLLVRYEAPTEGDNEGKDVVARFAEGRLLFRPVES